MPAAKTAPADENVKKQATASVLELNRRDGVPMVGTPLPIRVMPNENKVVAAISWATALKQGRIVIGLRREAYICKRAYELAGSGLHIEPLTVVSALVEEGFPEASDLLNSEEIRRDLHIVCAQNWRGAQRH